jgi:hypothetical protein
MEEDAAQAEMSAAEAEIEVRSIAPQAGTSAAA